MGVGRRLAALGRVRELEEQVADLEARVSESELLHQRFADLLDVVTHLLVPLAEGDSEQARAAIQRYLDELGS